MAVKQLTWDAVEDWEKGQFSWTHVQNPRGVLTTGWPNKSFGFEKFLFRFNQQSGSQVVSETDPKIVGAISGAYSWKITHNGERFLSLEAGQVGVSGSSAFALDKFVLGCVVTIEQYPNSDFLIIGQSEAASPARIFLTPEGFLKLSTKTSSAKVPRGRRVLISLIGSVSGYSDFVIICTMDGQIMAQETLQQRSIPRLSNAGFQIGPGTLDVFLAWLAEGIEQDTVALPTSGRWISDNFDLGDLRRLSAIEVDGTISSGHEVEITALLSENKYLAPSETAAAKMKEPGTFVLPTMVHGKHGKVAVSLKSQAAEDAPSISLLRLHFGKYPFAMPLHLPMSPLPDEEAAVYAVPDQAEVVVRAGALQSDLKIARMVAEEGEIQATINETTFSRKIRPRRGWPEFGRMSTRNFISPYKVSPPIWLKGRLDATDPILGQPLVTETGIVIAEMQGVWLAWDGFGKPLWYRRDPYPQVGRGCVFSESLAWPTSVDVRCVDTRDGSLRWIYAPIFNPSGNVSFLENGTLLVPLENGTVIFLSVSGILLKTVDSGMGSGSHLDSAYSDVPYQETAHQDYPAQYQAPVNYNDYEVYTDTYSVHARWTPPEGHADVFFPGGHSGHIDNSASPLHWDTWRHSDVAHIDIAHGDAPHADARHSDIPYVDVTAEGAEGRGVRFTDEAFLEEILLVFPAFATVINQAGELVSVCSGPARMTCATINDELSASNSAATIRLVHAGFSNGLVITFSADTGAEFVRRQLEGSVRFILAAPFENLPILVGTSTKLCLLSQNLDSVWEIDLPSEPAGWPVVSDVIVLALNDRVWCVRPDGILETEILSSEAITGSPVIMKTGTILVPSEKGILVYSSYAAAPFLAHTIFPSIPHSSEEFYLVDKSSEMLGELASVRWIVRDNQTMKFVEKISIDHAGSYEIIHQATNRLGQRSDAKIRVKVYPSLVEQRPVVWEVEAQVPKRCAIIARPEDEMRIFYPEEGMNEVYQDQTVELELEIFGSYRDLTDSSVVFKLKASESMAAPTLLQINGTLTEPTEGRAKVVIRPTDWKSIGAGTYYWGVYVAYPAPLSLTELAGRGRVELRPALA